MSDVTDTTIVLTEVPLKALDVERIVGLHDGSEPVFRVLVPADTKRNVLVSVLNHLSLFEMREALETLKPIDRTEAHADAEQTLAESLEALTQAGVQATGAITDDDPLPTLEAEVEAGASEVVIVTEPTPCRTPSTPTGPARPASGSAYRCCTSTRGTGASAEHRLLPTHGPDRAS